MPAAMINKVQLITYIDRLGGGGITELDALLHGTLKGLFGGVHLLPFFTLLMVPMPALIRATMPGWTRALVIGSTSTPWRQTPK
jgi:hypothetical protein